MAPSVIGVPSSFLISYGRQIVFAAVPDGQPDSPVSACDGSKTSSSEVAMTSELAVDAEVSVTLPCWVPPPKLTSTALDEGIVASRSMLRIVSASEPATPSFSVSPWPETAVALNVSTVVPVVGISDVTVIVGDSRLFAPPT